MHENVDFLRNGSCRDSIDNEGLHKQGLFADRLEKLELLFSFGGKGVKTEISYRDDGCGVVRRET
jgi:hypothetical protein